MSAQSKTTQEKSFLTHVSIGVLLTFIAINLKFIVANIIKPLILFNILHPIGHAHRHYEFHVPNFPDMCGDIITIILFVAAYQIMRTSSVREKLNDIAFGFCDTDRETKLYFQRLRDHILWGKNIFYIAATGFLFYFFSKYILTPYLEVFFIGEAEEGNLFKGLNFVNSGIKLFADLLLVYTYFKYIGANKYFKPLFNTVFSF